MFNLSKFFRTDGDGSDYIKKIIKNGKVER